MPNTATYGQLITAPGGALTLQDFSFYISQASGGAVNYQAYVYAWDPAAGHLTGSALYTSAVSTATVTGGFSEITVNTSGVSVTPGTEYVLFLTTSGVTNSGTGSFSWNANSGATAGLDGFVYMNNGTDFSLLSSNAWASIAENLQMNIDYLGQGIDTSAPHYLASSVGSTVLADFQGGVLQTDVSSITSNFTLENYATNTIDSHGISATFSGVLSGAGGVTIEDTVGGGSVIFTGDNTYNGATTIDKGATLQLGNGGATGSVAGNITDNGSLVFDHGANATYGGQITGTGSVNVAATGYPLYFTGANSYSGGTTIGSGTALYLGNGGTSGSITGDVVVNGGDLVFDRSDNVSFAGKISGSGWITLLGGDTVALTADNTFSGPAIIRSGSTLQLGAGGTTGSVAGNIMDLGGLVFDRSNTLVVNGVISGTGALTQAGSGVTILDGVNTVTGATTVTSGVLEVGDAAHPNAVLNSRLGGVSVGAGGTLAGHGTIVGAVTNTAGGVVSPGGSIGTLTVGSYTQGANSTLAIEVSPTQASQLNVVGAASLNGKLSLAFDPGTYSAHIYEIVAGGSVSGTFSNVSQTGNASGVVAGLDYTPDQVDLVVAPTSGARAFGDVSTATLDRVRSLAGLVADRVGDTGCSRPMAALQGQSGQFSATTTVGQGGQSQDRGGACTGVSAWAQALVSTDRLRGESANNAGGFIGGVDRRFRDGSAVGLAFGLEGNSLQMGREGAQASGDSYFASLYGRRPIGRFLLDGEAFAMKSDWSMTRSVAGYGAASSSPKGVSAGALLQISAPLFERTVSPYARVTWAEFDRNGVTESGVGPLGYTVQSDTSATAVGEAGVLLTRTWSSGTDRRVEPSLRIGVQQDFASRDRNVDAGLAGVAGTSFMTGALRPGATAGVADATFKAEFNRSFQLLIDASGRISNNQTEGAITLGGAFHF